MYYYSVDGNEILKYEVSFDLEKVKELQENLFRDCSIKRAGSYLCYGIPRRNPLTIYNKFEFKQVGVQEDFYGDREIYQVDYVEIVKPKLYNLIDEIIAGNVESLKDVVMRSQKRISYTFVTLFKKLFRQCSGLAVVVSECYYTF